MYQDDGVFQFGDFWEHIVPEEVRIVETINTPHLRELTVTSDYQNGPVKTRVNISLEFDKTQFHKVMILPYLNGN